MSWKPIEAWLREHFPAGVDQLASPADEGDLRRFEEEFGTELPEAFHDAWREHDGETLDAGEYLIPGVQHLPLAAIRAERDQMNALLAGEYSGDRNVAPAAGPVRPQFWNLRWIPFALRYGASDYYCIDLDPPEGGIPGQVILVSAKLWERTVVSPSLTEYFDDIAARLRDGRLAVVEGVIKEVEGKRPAPVAAVVTEAATTATATAKVTPGEVRRLVVGLGLAAVFWVALYFAVTRQTPAAIVAAVAAWVAWFVARRVLERRSV